MDDINTPEEETLPEGEITPTDGEGTESEEVGVKDVLGEALGKEFKDDETALKSVKDTFSYVGGMGQKVKELETELEKAKGQQTPELTEKVNSLERDLLDVKFYKDNPQYEAHKDLINSLGSNPEEVIKSDVFKSTYDKLEAHDKTEKSKSVLQSNSRLGKVTDKISKAKEALNAGNQDEAEASAVSAVIDAYEEE